MLITLRNISLAYSQHALLDGADMVIEDGDRVCLVGRNGAGKSSLMKIIAGEVLPDSGERTLRDGVKITRLIQEVPHDITGSVYSIVAEGLEKVGPLYVEYQNSNTSTERMLEIQHLLEENGGWDSKIQIDSVLSRMDLDPNAAFESLSGGIKRRVLLAQALVSKPDVLLLDEPTNHLDIEAVSWMEEFLRAAPFALVFITHDRAFLDSVAKRIVEVDRGKLFDWPGDFEAFRAGKEEALAIEDQTNKEFDKKLAVEESWIRRGVKARTKRNMGRVGRLEDARKDAGKRQKYQQTGSINAQVAETSGKRVFEAENISYSIAGKKIVDDFSIEIRRGQKIALMGPNGCGKTTLLRLLMGQLEVDSGIVTQGTNLKPAYFDQTRSQLNLEESAAWNINEGSDKVIFNGESQHVLGYLRNFMFTAERANSAVKVLSGGERNRLLLARLFAQPANVLILDEPTNDLDVETLELLENLIEGYQGTVMLVSHDRAFVNNVAESILAWEGEGQFNYYVGNYDDWLRQRKQKESVKKQLNKPAAVVKKPAKKLSYKDQRELDELPAKLEQLEELIDKLQAEMSSPEFYQQDADIIAAGQQKMTDANNQLEQAFERWEALEALQLELAG